MQENLQVLLTGSLSLVKGCPDRELASSFVKTEAIIAGNAATALVALVFSILTGKRFRHYRVWFTDGCHRCAD